MSRVINAAVSRQKASDTAIPFEFFKTIVTKIPDMPQAAADIMTNATPNIDPFIRLDRSWPSMI
jgi:hypothetical protein